MYHYHIPLAEVGAVPMEVAWGLIRVLPMFTGAQVNEGGDAELDELFKRAEKLGVRARS